MGLSTKQNTKDKAIDFAKEQLQDTIQTAVEDKVAEVVAEKTLDHAINNMGASYMPWWLLIMWWPIKYTALLITWPLRILFKRKR